MRHLHTYIILILLCLFAKPAAGQLHRSGYGDGLAVTTTVKYGYSKDAHYRTNVLQEELFTIDWILFQSTYSPMGYQVSHRWTAIGDIVIPFFYQVFNKREQALKDNSSSLTSLYLGWHNHSFALISRPKFQLAAGVHWGDYVYIFKQYEADKNRMRDIEEPSGYYFGAGPALVSDIALTDHFFLHYEFSWANGWRMRHIPDQVTDEAYPAPFFWNHLVDIRTDWGVHAGVEFAHISNRGYTKNNTYRLGLYAGYTF